MTTEAAARLKKIQRKSRCQHLHLSGRRCGSPSGRSRVYCGAHSSGFCEECRDMMQTFTPPKGW